MAPGLVLGAGGIAGAPLGALIGARLPERWTLLLFAALMAIIGLHLWQEAKEMTEVDSRFACRRDPDEERRLRGPCVLKLLAAGVLTGVLSGTFGVGGGFLVVPALLLVTAMPIERALASSLVCIFLISTSGFAANLLSVQHLDLRLTALFLAGGAAGMTIGAALKSRLPGLLLKRLFASSVLGVAIWIAIQTCLGKEPNPQVQHPIPAETSVVAQHRDSVHQQ